jgi:acetylglutamate kinase
MIPKLRSCARTLARQVKEIDLLPPAVPGALLGAVRSGNQIGTRIVK